MKSTLAIVLGKGISPEGVLSDESKKNVEKGVELFKSKEVDAILFTGGYTFMLKSPPAKTEAVAMMEYAISLGVPKSSISIEEKSLDTTGNAYYSIDIVSAMPWVKKLVLVATDHHMERASYLFRKAFPNFNIRCVATKSNLTPEQLKAKQSSERETLELMRKLFDEAGNTADFKAGVLRTNPLYGSDPSMIPEIVWKAFEGAGMPREVLISKYMRQKSKS